MRPTFSIIAFTVLSGIGYGAWFLIGLGLAIGMLCGDPQPFPAHSGCAPSATALIDAACNEAAAGPHPEVTLRLCRIAFLDAIGFVAAGLLVVAGLLASLGHLGKPLRAWRALSQWRSSWLSREGVAALLTFVPAIVLALHWLGESWLVANATGDHIAPRWWNGLAWSDAVRPALGVLLAAGSLATVFCTANIYASLKTIRAWHERHVVPVYLLLAAYGGSLLLLAATTIGGMMWQSDRQVLGLATIVLAMLCGWLKLRYWRSIDAQPATSAGHATGLDRFGVARPLEAPHTEENYLTHEMGFVLARKHARKLRAIALVAAFLLPALLAALALAAPAMQAWLAWPAFVSALLGLFVERWLFFAEARHAVTAYYAR